MICRHCAAGADVASRYRDAEHADGRGRTWLVHRLRLALGLHIACTGCTCQHRIPELKP